MNKDFPRVIALLRKEKGISQKKASSDLGISQALLSHYEKGIRECGLDFLVRCARYYGVSADYLLGISPEKHGVTLQVEDIPEPEAMGKTNVGQKSILPTLNKKLIANSLNILYDYLSKGGDPNLTTELSNYLMIAVYRAFRVAHSANRDNPTAMFRIPCPLMPGYAMAGMAQSGARAAAIASEEKVKGVERLKNREAFRMDTDQVTRAYPLFATSLFNLIQRVETIIDPVFPSSKGKK